MPAGDVFGLDGFFLNKSNPITVSTIGINSTGSSAGIAVTGGSFVDGTYDGAITLNLSNAAGLTTTPFYYGARIAVSGLVNASGVAHTGYNGTFVVAGFAGTTTVSYATTGYVGSVAASIAGQTGRVVLLTDTVVTNTTWSSAQTHGWFGGGAATPAVAISTVDRVDFSNDTGTTNIRASLSLARQGLAATGNSNYGWFGGGAAVPLTTRYSTIDRVDFSNDSLTASVRGPLSSERGFLAATGNSNYGWFCAGNIETAVRASTIHRIDFSNDSGAALLRGRLTESKSDMGSAANINYGWFGGGTPITSRVDRIDFSNDSSTASVRSPLSIARSILAATGNSNYGWFGGGSIPGSPIILLSTIDRIDFSNDLAAISVRGLLSAVRYRLAATGNSNYGWFGGGNNSVSIVDRIDFSNDSATASPRGPLSTARNYSAATSGQARSLSTRLQKVGNYGWFGGGSIPTPAAVSTVDRIDFSNDSVTASPRGPLSLARQALAATGNSNYGWFGGGTTPTPAQVSRVDRIDFSNDSPIASIRGPLSSARYALAATGNSNYGWFGGGYFRVTTVDRIDFSNDSGAVSVRGPLSSARYELVATGNSNYGWFGGGINVPPGPDPFTTESLLVDRIDFSNDSFTASVRGPLSLARYQLAATANSNYGWFGGGGNNLAIYSTVDRIDFSNDSSTASARGPLSLARFTLAAAGNSNYGWFGGGQSPGPTVAATVDRINFSNDSVSSSPRGPLSSARSDFAATSNTPVG